MPPHYYLTIQHLVASYVPEKWSNTWKCHRKKSCQYTPAFWVKSNMTFSGFRGKAQGLIAQGKTWIDKKSSLYLALPWHPNNNAMLQGCRKRGTGVTMPPPDFGISVNPILTRALQGRRLCPHITTGTLGFSDLPTALKWHYHIVLWQYAVDKKDPSS